MRTALLLLTFLFFSISTALSQDYKLGYVIGNTVSFPYDIALGPDNNLYLADNYSTRVFNLSGTMLNEYHLTGRYHDTNSHMATSLDSEGNMYTISFGSRIHKISPDNEVLLSFGEEGSLPGQLNNPTSLVVAKDGTIIVADTENHRIQKFDQQGNLLSVIGSFGELPGQFNLPGGLALDKEENLYVTDPYNARIQIFDKSGNYLSDFGSGWSFYPDDIALDAEGYVYITELYSHQVIKLDTTGYWHMNFGSKGTGNGQFTGSRLSLTLDKEGNIYVADRDNDSRVQKFSPEGEFLLDFGNFRSNSADKLYPYAIKSDQVGNYFVAFSNSIIQKYDPEGNLLFAFGGKGTDNGKFTSQITSMELDQAGNLYVLSKETAGSVQKFTPNGVFISRFAPASSTGTGSPTALANPIYLKMDPQGNVYVSDDIYLYQYSPEGRFIKRQTYINNETGAPISFKEGVFNSRLKFSIDKEGALYILFIRKSKKFTLNGEFLGDFLPPNAYPNGFTVFDMDFDGQNNMYLSEWGHIYKYDAQTKALVASSRNYSYIFHILQNSFSVNKSGSRIIVLSPNNTVASFTNNEPITLPESNNITGIVFNDRNSNCIFDEDDSPLPGILVEATPGPYYSISDQNGYYTLPVGAGTYHVKEILPAEQSSRNITACQADAQQVSFASLGQTQMLHLGNRVTLTPYLSVSVSSDRRRRCFESTTTVKYSNTGFATAPDAKVYLQLPGEVELLSANKSYTLLANGTYEFAVGDLEAGQSGIINIQDLVTCGDESVRNRTVCTRAWITPSNNKPAQPTPTVSISGRCHAEMGMIRFVVRNTGTADMRVPGHYRKYADGELASVEQYRLAAGDSMVFWVPSMGYTWRIEADQPDGNGDNTKVSLAIEGCTDGATMPSTGQVNLLPTDDEEAERSEECMLITDSYDPNDKLVTPVGRTEEFYTPTNTALKYKIRFQNTGTDVAYRIVVVDTLSEHLDLSTLQVGATSHTSRLEVSGKGRPVLTWTFDNIMLPDSTADEPGSHGYIQFSIKPKADLAEKTLVENFADIFFDFNSPIRTNVTQNRIYDMPPVINEAVRVHLEDVLATPGIAGFAPAAGKFGSEVTISGQRFAPKPGDNKVYLNGKPATVVNASANELKVLVPTGTTTGAVKVITPDGGVTSSAQFQVYQPPVLASFSPAEGMVGQTVTLNGEHLQPEMIDGIKLGDLSCEILSNNGSTVTVRVPAEARTGSFRISTKGGEALSNLAYTVWYAPRITSLSKQTDIVGASITINGEQFATDKARNQVRFGKALAQVLEASPQQLTVRVPEQAETGLISVETPGGKAFTTTNFEVIPGPRFTAMQPTRGTVGTVVEITGEHFGIMGLQDKIVFNGQEALVLESTGDRYKVRVPRGASTGKVTITGFGGQAQSSSDFVIEELAPAEAITVYPNPNNGTFTVSLRHADFDVQSVEVYDALGKRLHQTRITGPRPETVEISLPAAKSGLYFLQIQTERGLLTKKLTVM